jgi:TPR repeat protein
MRPRFIPPWAALALLATVSGAWAQQSAPPAFDKNALKQQAVNGDAKAQYLLGYSYERGWGVPQDYKQASAWYRKAAERGDTDAQLALGTLYEYGEGVSQDYTQAVFWYRKAAEQGGVLAQRSLGLMYEQGDGVPQSYAEAYFWFDLAAAGIDSESWDSERAVKFRDDAASHLTPSDLSRIQERARKWFEEHPAKPQ